MKKLVVGSLLFVLTVMLFTNVFAETKNITEYCGNNGLLLRRSSPIEPGDVLNIKNDIKQESEATYQVPANYILSQGIKINGGGHKLDGNDLGGFIMQQYNTGMDTDSEINDATLQHYSQNVANAVIDVRQQYVYDKNFNLTLNNVKITSNSCTAVSGLAGNIKLNDCTIKEIGSDAITSSGAKITLNNVKISSVSRYGINAGKDDYLTPEIYVKDSSIEETANEAIYIDNTYLEARDVKINHCNGGLNIRNNSYASLYKVTISSVSQEGVEVSKSDVTLTDCEIKDTWYEAVYATNGSTVTIVATKDLTYNGGIGGYKSFDIQNSTISFLIKDGANVKLSSGISGSGFMAVGDGEEYTGTLVLSGDSSNYGGDVEINGATIKLLAGSKYFNGSNHTVWDGKLDILNNSSDTINISRLSGSTLKIDLDVNLDDTWYSDYINVGSSDIENIIINKINVSSDSVSDVVDVEVISSVVRSSTTLNSSQKRVYGPIYGYDVFISSTGSNGQVVVDTSSVKTSTSGNILTFQRAQGSYNPRVLQPKVAIAGASISQEEVFDTVFNNAGNYTFFQKQGSSAGDVEDRAAPTLWVKAFGSQEDVDLENYTKVKTNYFGAVVGLDCDRQYTDNFDATYGLFASYIGGELKDDDSNSSVKQNGGYLGVRGNWYIGKLFFNAIVDYGMISNSADSSSDSNDFKSQVVGLAARAGYNFEVARRSFTIQPNLGVTGKYIITDDFKLDDIKEEVDNITNITIEPGIKLAKNLGKCWILSGEGKYVIENVSGDVKVEDIVLPDMSYKNYANVGLGIEKIWGYTVLHIKGNKTFGGRDGFVVNAGIEFKF